MKWIAIVATAVVFFVAGSIVNEVAGRVRTVDEPTSQPGNTMPLFGSDVVRIQLWDRIVIECDEFSNIPPWQLEHQAPGPQEGQKWDIVGAGRIVVWFANSKMVPEALQVVTESSGSPPMTVNRSQHCRQQWKLKDNRWIK
jgi:hypothetical protein